MPEDLYRTLQVEPNADLETIHVAYRRLARLYHPDLNPRPGAAERMRAINTAYRVLSDPRQRAVYDARRFVQPAPARTAVAARPRPKPTQPAPSTEPPSQLQRHVDRAVAVIGVILLILIVTYVILVIPRAASGQTHTNAGTVPDRLRQDTALRGFPGDVLVPPADLAPFKDLPLLRLDATGQGIARYAVYYGDLSTGVASVTGLVGRAAFDSAAPHLPDCAPEATYCAGLAVGQSAGDSPGVEVFKSANLVADFPAFAIHRVCCNGVFWSLSWYEPGPNMSYTIDLSRNVAAQFGGNTADGDGNAARAVAALANRLVRLP